MIQLRTSSRGSNQWKHRDEVPHEPRFRGFHGYRTIRTLVNGAMRIAAFIYITFWGVAFVYLMLCWLGACSGGGGGNEGGNGGSIANGGGSTANGGGDITTANPSAEQIQAEQVLAYCQALMVCCGSNGEPARICTSPLGTDLDTCTGGLVKEVSGSAKCNQKQADQCAQDLGTSSCANLDPAVSPGPISCQEC